MFYQVVGVSANGTRHVFKRRLTLAGSRIWLDKALEHYPMAFVFLAD